MGTESECVKIVSKNESHHSNIINYIICHESDVILVSGCGLQFHTSSLLLALSSKLLRFILNKEHLKEDHFIIYCQDFSGEIIKLLINYIITGTVQCPNGQIMLELKKLLRDLGIARDYKESSGIYKQVCKNEIEVLKDPLEKDFGFDNPSNHINIDIDTINCNEHQCPSCSNTFSSPSDLSNHLNSIHFENRQTSDYTPYETEDRSGISCKKTTNPYIDDALPPTLLPTFTLPPIPTPTEIESNKLPTYGPFFKFKCDVCDKSFRKKWSFERHYKIHLNQFDNACEHCGKIFKTEYTKSLHNCEGSDVLTNYYSVKDHKLKMDSIEVNYNRDPLNISKEEKIAKIKADRKEKIEKINLIKEEKLKDKIKILDKECSSCDERFSNLISLKRHVRLMHTIFKRTDCEHCEKTFKLKCNYYLHLEMKHGIFMKSKQPIICTKCNLTFNTRTEKYYHFNKIHMPIHRKNNPEQKHCCSICGKILSTKFSLRAHEAYSHTREYRFYCENCGKGFYYDGVMKKHSQRCMKEKSHNCGLCGQSFKTYIELNQHRKTHNIDDYEKNHKCNNCDEKFLTKGQRYRHNLRVHSTNLKRYKCKECTTVYTNRGGAIDHIIAHHSDFSPFECNICGITKNFKSGVSQHIKYNHRKAPLKERIVKYNRHPKLTQIIEDHLLIVHKARAEEEEK